MKNMQKSERQTETDRHIFSHINLNYETNNGFVYTPNSSVTFISQIGESDGKETQRTHTHEHTHTYTERQQYKYIHTHIHRKHIYFVSPE